MGDGSEAVRSRISPFFWGGLFMVLALALSLYVAHLEEAFFGSSNISSPNYSAAPVLLYFFGVVAVLTLVLILIPLSKLRWVFRALFALLFGWGVFIVAGLTLPGVLPYVLAAAAVVASFWARIWLHDLLLLVALSAAGATFGFLVSPLTFMIVMLVIAVYDVLAVRFGLMVWMADRMSASDTLPAFILPRRLRDWAASVRGVRVGELKDTEAAQREYSILGGGDIGFPLMLTASVFFASGLGGAVLIGGLATVGLMGAFLIQMLWFKNRPVPALPPITFAALIGFLIVMFVM